MQSRTHQSLIVPVLLAALAIGAFLFSSSPRVASPGADSLATTEETQSLTDDSKLQIQAPLPDITESIKTIENLITPGVPSAGEDMATSLPNTAPGQPEPAVDVEMMDVSPRGAYFTVGGKGFKGPLFQKGFLDPLEPQRGERQTLGIRVVSGASPVTGAEVTVETDREKRRYPLTLTKGTTHDGVWVGTWEVADTHEEKYSITIIASDAAASSSIVISLR